MSLTCNPDKKRTEKRKKEKFSKEPILNMKGIIEFDEKKTNDNIF